MRIAAERIIDFSLNPLPPPPAPPDLPEVVWIAPRTFTMGRPPTELAPYDNGGPQTKVTTSRGFWMGKYEVTQGEYLAVMGNDPSHFRNGISAYFPGTAGPVTNESIHPVESMDWYADSLPGGSVTLGPLHFRGRTLFARKSAPGDRLRTGADSRAVLRLHDQSRIRIAELSELGLCLPGIWTVFDMLEAIVIKPRASVAVRR